MNQSPEPLARLSTRVGTETLREAKLHAARRGESLQDYVTRALAKENKQHARRNP